MRSVLLIIQHISIIGLFIESLLILSRKWNNSLHTYLLLSCASSLINNIGYLMELSSSNEDTYIAALKFSYFGRIWHAFFLFLFVAELVKRNVPLIIRNILLAVSTFIYIFIANVEYHTLYYSEYHFEFNDGIPRFIHSQGILHNIFMSLQVVYIAIALIWLFIASHKEKRKLMKHRLILVITSLILESSFFIVQIIGIPGLTDVYDITMIGYFLGTVVMLVAFFKCDLLGTSDIAKDFMIDRISESVIAVDSDGTVRYYNETANKFFPCLKKAINDEQFSKNPECILSSIKKALQEEGSIIKVKDRIYTPEENDLVHDGESVGKLYVLVDNTEHFRMANELVKQKEIADSANEAKSRFLANMSHEIRTPINAVLGMDEMILRETKDKNIHSYASDIKSAGRTLLSLINEILDFSKVEQGKMEIIPVQYELSSLINDLVNMIKERADKKNLEFKVEVDPNIPHSLTGDEIRIRQCVMNILSNAVKYTEKGSIKMTVSFTKGENFSIMLGFKVEDTGIGMKEEDLNRLFTPYERFEEKRNRTIEGTGLGMNITRQLLGLMGTDLHVKSTYGKGSVFSFEVKQDVISWERLGDYSSRMHTTGLEEYHELFYAPDAKLLVVDDTEMNLTVIGSLLKETGMGIDFASSGKEAIALSDKNHYDVMLIDHMMPVMDGIETLEHIKKSGKNTETPAVMLTANAVSGARNMYIEAGFTDYLTKPVDGMRLEMMLYKLLPKDKLKDENASGTGEKNSKRKYEDHPVESGSRENPDEKSVIPEWLKKVLDLDYKAGIKNCGSEEGYLEVLKVFHQTAELKSNEIENHFKEGDISSYTIKVHALKSSARIIGAGELSSLAEKLEKAGKDNDTVYIEENNGRLLEQYRMLNVMLKNLDIEDESLPLISKEAMKEAYQTILEIAGSMDYELMDSMLKELGSYHLEEKDKENLVKIQNYLTSLDWDSIIQLVVST